jgi:hypothetical protein
MTNIIADVAGQYKALMALVNKMPPGEFISLGDMCDRGPDSKEVFNFFMQPGNQAILGNHEHMMIDYCRKGGYYDYGVWFWNGGRKTLESFGEGRGLQNPIPKEYIDWADSLPLYLEIDGCLLSHSFVTDRYGTEDALEYSCDLGTYIMNRQDSIIWNREYPIRLKDYKYQVVGHNSQFGLRYWADQDGEFAVCLDDSKQRKLTGMVLETGEIFQQEYI